MEGFEPPVSWPQTRRVSKLRYIQMLGERPLSRHRDVWHPLLSCQSANRTAVTAVLAGTEGFEPSITGLEPVGLPLA